jgi:hypothetical protein
MLNQKVVSLGFRKGKPGFDKNTNFLQKKSLRNTLKTKIGYNPHSIHPPLFHFFNKSYQSSRIAIFYAFIYY